ncbi:ankyrin repeat domain-containing protein [Limnobaculum xujianqingii]|uniref:ankyrin repeat domain-containing protein n=1 Tax=Limnobaculum xujianqingii TaxID=2738837 RepID=UPI001127A7A2|nr:ankyrin repeat domain-containing protein [Limnobaculum xujianqingii]
MLSLSRNIFLVLVCYTGSFGNYAYALFEGLPPNYFEAQLYLSEGQGRFVKMTKLDDKSLTAILTIKGTKFQTHAFDKSNPEQKNIGNKPAPIYSSPELPVYPSLLKPNSNLATRMFSNTAQQSLFIAYGLESGNQACIDHHCIKQRAKKDFEFHGFMLIPLSLYRADSAENQYRPTVIGFDGVENSPESAQPQVVFTQYSGEWNEDLKKQAKDFFEQGWASIYKNISFPENISYQQPAIESVQLQELRKIYSEVAATQFGSKGFNQAFTKMQTFFKHNRYQDLDKENKHSTYTIWLTDYGYWLFKTNQTQEAIEILHEAVSRDAGNPAKYLVLADAQMHMSMSMPYRLELKEKRTYYSLAAKDNYRQYCRFMLEQDKEIKGETQVRIKHYLGINEIKPEYCIAHFRLVNAVRNGKLNLVQSLIDQGLNANIQGYYGRSLLGYAVNNNNYNMVSLLLKNGADAAFTEGEGNGRQGILVFALKNLSWQAGRLAKDQPLNTRLADLLLSNGADINALSLNNSWVLMDAIIDRADERVIRYLLANGANPQLKEANTYKTPLIASLTRNLLDTAQILMQEGKADVNYTTYSSLYQCGTPLIFFLNELDIRERRDKVGSVKPEVITTLKMLFEKGADPTLGGKSKGKECSEKNGWEVVEMLARKIPSPELRCIIDQHRPSDAVSSDKENSPLCHLKLVKKPELKHGKWVYWNNSNMKYSSIYKNDNKISIWRGWDNSNKTTLEQNYGSDSDKSK